MPNFKAKKFQDGDKIWINFRSLCKSCGICLDICPQQALFWGKELGFYGNPAPDCDIKKCIACGLCQLHCPDCAILVKKLEKQGGKS